MLYSTLNPLISNVVAGPDHMVATTGRCPSARIIRKLRENKGLLLIGSGSYTVHLGPCGEVRGREKAGDLGSGVLLLLGLTVGA